MAAECRHWQPLAPDVTGFEHQLVIPQWDLCLRVMIYRKHVRHESPKNFHAFIGGRGAQEKTIAELKGEFALDVVPTRHCGANCA